MKSRRDILKGAAVAAILPVPVAAMPQARHSGDDRLLAAIAKGNEMLDRYDVARARSVAAFALVEADPDMPRCNPVQWATLQIALGSKAPHRALLRLHRMKCERVYERHGYHAAWDAWNRLHREMFSAFERIASMRPKTLAGAVAKARFFARMREADEALPEYAVGATVFPSLVADIEALAVGEAA